MKSTKPLRMSPLPLLVLGAVCTAAVLVPSWWTTDGLIPAARAESDKDRSDDDAEKDKKPPAAKDCVTHTSEARYVYGYNHLVHVKNDCEKSARCQVSTNVNPQVQSIVVPAHQKKTVLTFRGSPSREFEAKVECELTK